MASATRVRRGTATIAFEALSIEGGLLSADWLARVAQLSAGGQGEADYRIPKGLNLRDEIGRYWRIAVADSGPGFDGAAGMSSVAPGLGVVLDARAQAGSSVHGLGLRLVHEVMERHHGIVRIGRNEPRGALVELLLPVGPATLEAPGAAACQPVPLHNHSRRST